MNRPLLLDAFCGAGGAAMGYHRAGFEVIGVDISPQPRYPFEVYQGDALDFIRQYGKAFDAIHASPPCQAYTPLNAYNHKEYPDLINETRKNLTRCGAIWVIENVPGAPLIRPTWLCGSMFELKMYRHRGFESPINIPVARHPRHNWICTRNGYLPTTDRPFMSIHGGKHSQAWQRKAAEYLDTPWMLTIREVCEAIPPAYAEYVGQFLMKSILRQPADDAVFHGTSRQCVVVSQS